MGVTGITKFEDEAIDSILWQLEGYWNGRVTKRATARILRASLRRVNPPIAAHSVQSLRASAGGPKQRLAIH